MGRAADAMPVLSVPKRRGRRVDVPEPVFRFTRGIAFVAGFATKRFASDASERSNAVKRGETSY